MKLLGDCSFVCDSSNGPIIFCFSAYLFHFFAAVVTLHLCASVLNKRFLTPFRDDIWNRRQVSVGNRGVLPTRPRNRRRYALLAHTLGKIKSGATDERSNTVIRKVVLKRYNYTGEIISGRKYIPHSQFPLNVSVRIYMPHGHFKENVSIRRYITHNFPR